MVVLGLHIEHDASVTIIKDGNILLNIAQEKLTRVKKDWRFDIDLIKFALKQTNLTIKDIDRVAINCFKPGHGVRVFLDPTGSPASKYSAAVSEICRGPLVTTHNKELVGNTYHLMFPHLADHRKEPQQLYWIDVDVEILDHIIPGYIVNHHIAHAANAFYLSPFKTAAIFSLDASNLNGILPEYSSLFAYGKDKIGRAHV